MSYIRLLIPSALLALVLVAAAPAWAQQKNYTEAEAAQHAGEVAAVTGKVIAVSKTAKGTTYLNFGDRFPRHTFSGVVLARDEAKVGDVKTFEGKMVTITGKIEMSPDSKPQILISAPTQIKLAEGGETPAPQPMPATTPASVPVAKVPAIPTPTMPAIPAPVAPLAPIPKAPEAKKMVLAPNWSSPAQGGEMTRKDLASVFGLVGSASQNVEGDPTVVLFNDITFLSPLAAAKKKLQLEGASATVTKVTVPGLPIGSFSAHMYSGVFVGGFNRLYLVTDLAEQVVSVLLVDENPRQRTPEVTDTMGYHTYNFVSGRSKGTNELVIKHVASADAKGVVVVETTLVDPTDGNPPPKNTSGSRTTSTTRTTNRTGKVMERSRWFVPEPVVNLILRCVGNR